MFEVRGEKEKIKSAVQQFVDIANEELFSGEYQEQLKNKITDGALGRLPGSGTVAKKLEDKLDNIVLSYEETEKGYKVMLPVLSEISDVPAFGSVFKAMMRKSRNSLESYMEKVRYCEDCGSLAEKDDEECPECGGNNLTKIDFEIE